MSTVNILWLYDDLLDLYGDSGNLTLLTNRLTAMGLEVKLSRLSLGDHLDFTLYHMVYLGPGKAKNLAKASEHFYQYADQAKAAVDDGLLFLVTGNARLLFGQTFTDCDGATRNGIGLFDYTGRETGNVFISDVIAAPVFAPNTLGYGFINRTAHIDGNTAAPLFMVRQGAGDNELDAQHEGNLLRNFFGTWQLGPVLVKNPHLLCEVLRRLAGDAYHEPDNSLEQKALDLTLAEFTQ